MPSNWREVPGNNSVTFAPDGAYGSSNGQSVFTHGVEIGVSRNETHNLQQATDELIQSLGQGNPALSRASGYDRITIDGRQGLRTVLSNTSEATGQREAIQLATTQLGDGTLLYTIGVAPADQFSSYRNVFDRVLSSLRASR